MIVYVARRVALAVVVVAGVIVLTFVIAHLVPGDPAATWAGPHASAAQIAAARRYLGLDRPPAVQLLSYLGGILSGNWGVSIHTHQPVLSDLAGAAPASLELVRIPMDPRKIGRCRLRFCLCLSTTLLVAQLLF